MYIHALNIENLLDLLLSLCIIIIIVITNNAMGCDQVRYYFITAVIFF